MPLSIQEFYRRYLGIEEPYDHQEELWNLINDCKFPILLRAPTGSGKTEAVVAPFLHQFLTRDFKIAPRLIYVLPTRVLVNNITERIKKYASSVSDRISVAVQHGALPSSAFFMQDVVVTTLDQFLYGYARSSRQVGRHIDLPAGAIASSLVVFDEAHMYHDKYTFAILKALLEILNACNIPFVVMTATLPKSLEESLFQNIELSNGSFIKANIPKSSKIRIQLVDDALLKTEKLNISNELLEKMQKKKTLIVVNQVQRAQKIYSELLNLLEIEKDKVVLLHSRFRKKDRDAHEAKAVSLMNTKSEGKISKKDGPGVIVSTQVLEAGVDFSAELLITEIAPADSLVQRVGRCARYAGEEGEVLIYTYELDKSEKTQKDNQLTELSAPYDPDDVVTTLKELRKYNIDFNDFDQITDFVNVLNYTADDYEATDALMDLFECTLYADDLPENIQARNSKSVRLLVFEEDGKKIDLLSAEMLRNLELAENIINLNFETLSRFVRHLPKDKKVKLYRLKWEPEGGPFGVQEIKIDDRSLNPFDLYALVGKYYDERLGLLTS